jgi:hypothetical protein
VSTHPLAQHCWAAVHAGPPAQLSGAWQLPSAHVSPAGQTLVQLPQWAGETFSLTHVPPQQLSPLAQPVVSQLLGGWQAPPRQLSPVEQTRPQEPQSEGSVPSSTQTEPQHDSPLAHAVPLPQVATHSWFWHSLPAGHWLVVSQPTHWRVPGSQIGLEEGQPLLPVHPVKVTHSWVAGLQASPLGQVSGEVKQATQTPAGSSQYGVAGVEPQSMLDPHAVVVAASRRGPPSTDGRLA